MNRLASFISLSFLLFFFSCTPKEEIIETDVLIIGKGTGATSAAIQSARSGAKTILVTPLPWLGGMLTSAGVSASDGNHELPAGIWGEFRSLIRQHYGGIDSVATGWISFTLFEPHVGALYFKQLAEKEHNLSIWYETNLQHLKKDDNWLATINREGKLEKISANILIDGTDLGDVAELAGAKFDVGMDAKAATNENMAPNTANEIVQDLTYVAILKDYGKDADKTISKPSGYDPSEFYCSCKANCSDEKAHPCATMLTYAQLPNNKYMINWPIFGNDYYVNAIALSDTERALAYEKAKNQTLRFVYYIQTELGYKHLGLADDEFPTSDGLALMPYHREGRRIKGQVQLNVNHLLQPYGFELYRTGIAVGDYPIDHHHGKNLHAPEIDFPAVPSFNIPMGALIPTSVDHFLIADKAMSVTNIVNGSSRLQPVILQIGQVAGLMAAMAVQQNKAPHQLDIRAVQSELLNFKGYLMPFIDVQPEHSNFAAIQRIGATGILKGEGIPYKWANQTWFYPDSTINALTFLRDLETFEPNLPKTVYPNQNLTLNQLINIVYEWSKLLPEKNQFSTQQACVDFISKQWTVQWKLSNFDANRNVSRTEIAVVVDKMINPFQLKSINFEGQFN